MELNDGEDGLTLRFVAKVEVVKTCHCRSVAADAPIAIVAIAAVAVAHVHANKKTRNKAFDILVQIGHAFGDEEQGGKTENLLQYFDMVVVGLAGGTPHMISAAIKGLARLAYEFTDLVSAAYNVLPAAFLLLQRKNREIIKANLGLLKVLVAKSQPERLQKHLKSLVEGPLR